MQLQSISCDMTCGDEQQDNANPVDQLQSQVFRHDLLLLENQIPFVVIKKIQETIEGGNNTGTSKLVGNIIDLVEVSLDCYPKAISKPIRPKDFHHLLHLCHGYFKPSSEEAERYEKVEPSFLMPHLSWGEHNQEGTVLGPGNEYNQAGIRFEKRKYCSENPHSLLDIVFRSGTIEIPSLTIDPITKTLFCNLVAFEQTCPQFGSYVTTYVIFLSSLISMPDDVSLFTGSGIIVHKLNSDAEVCNLFKEIRECAAIGYQYHSDNYLKPLYTEIEAHYITRRPVLTRFLGSIGTKICSWTKSGESSVSIFAGDNISGNPCLSSNHFS